MSAKVTSPLRYPGGKNRALLKILPFIPLDFKEYREPFLGGGSLFIALKQLVPEAKYKLGDLNPELYCFWSILKNYSDEFIKAVTTIKKTTTDGKALYRVLAKENQETDVFARAVRFFVLNRITYSGTIDSGGYSNQAFHKRFTEKNIAKLKPLSLILQDVEIVNDSYEKMLLNSGENVMIYLDPPYLSAKKKSLYGSKGSLNRFFDHQELARNIDTCKHKWFMTCDDSDEMRELFSIHHTFRSQWSYGMTNVNSKKTIIGKELFVASYPLIETEIDLRNSIVCYNKPISTV